MACRVPPFGGFTFRPSPPKIRILIPSMSTLPEPGPFRGCGEMGDLLRKFDWASTAVGPVDGWPEHLRTAVAICLNSCLPMACWWGRPQYTMFYNDAYRRVLGPARHPEWFGRSGKECWTDVWDTMGPLIDRVFETGEPTWSEDMLLVMNRELPRQEVYCTLSCSPVFDARGGVAGVLSACNETTERILTERRLLLLRDLDVRAAQTRTIDDACRAIGETLAEHESLVPFALIYLLGADGRARLRAASTRIEDELAPAVVDFGSGQPSRWPLANVVSSRTAVVVDDLSQQIGPLPGGALPELCQRAVLYPLSGGREPDVAGVLVVGLSPRRMYDERYHSFLDLLVRHISMAIANARAHEAVTERAEALAALDRANTAFLGELSYELRAPLTLILGPLEEALENEGRPLAPAQRARLEAVQHNASRLLKAVDMLVDVSNIAFGRTEPYYEPTDVSALTADLAGLFRSAMQRAHLSLLVDCPHLTEYPYVDRGMWEKIVLNLLSNALKFTFDGQITVTVRREERQVRLTVADTGIGIGPEDLPRLFDRYQRIRAARARTGEGAGLGLVLVRELVKLHGGDLGVDSTLGAGSVFTVSVPLGRDHLRQDRLLAPPQPAASHKSSSLYVEEAIGWLPDEPRPEPVAAESSTAGRFRVLVVDDHPDVRDYVARLLGEEHAVTAVSNGAEALRLAIEHPPDLVLSDVIMPGIDGFSLLSALRENPKTALVPVMLLSAWADDEARTRGLLAGADDYLVKPFTAAELRGRVGTQLQLGALRREVALRERRLRVSLEDFVAMLAHELRSPLHAIAGALTLLRRNISSGRALDVLERQVGYMSALLEELLDASRIARGKIELRPSRVEVRGLVSDALEQVHAAIERAHFRLDVDLPEQPLWISGDRVRLLQVVVNLLNNAIRYTPEGGRITIAAARVGDEIEIRVADTGQGIDPSVLPKVFELFMQAKRGAAGGLGIGLAVSAQLVRLHGGRIEAHSDGPDRGSEFMVSLPAAV